MSKYSKNRTVENYNNAYSDRKISPTPPDKLMGREEFRKWYFSTTPVKRRHQKNVQVNR